MRVICTCMALILSISSSHSQDYIYTIKRDTIFCKNGSIYFQNHKFSYKALNSKKVDTLSHMMVLSYHSIQGDFDHRTSEKVKLERVIHEKKDGFMTRQLDSLTQTGAYFAFTFRSELLIGDTLEWYIKKKKELIPFKWISRTKSYNNKIHIKVKDKYIPLLDVKIYNGPFLPGSLTPMIYTDSLERFGFDIGRDTLDWQKADFMNTWQAYNFSLLAPRLYYDDNSVFVQNAGLISGRYSVRLEEGYFNIYGKWSKGQKIKRTDFGYNRGFGKMKPLRYNKLKKDLVLCTDCLEILNQTKTTWSLNKKYPYFLTALRLYNELFK